MPTLQDIIARLNQGAVETLGVAAPVLSPQWAATQLTYNGPTASVPFSLTVGAAWFPPFTGIYSNQVKQAHFDLNGSCITGNLSSLRFHPQAAARLADLYAIRFGAEPNNPSHSLRPVPATMILRQAASVPTGTGTSMVRAGDQSAANNLPAAVVSFHDADGLILDPLAVAAAFADLLRTYPLLAPAAANFNPANSFTGKTGWVDAIAALDPAVTGYVQVVNPHGGPYEDPGTAMGLKLTPGGSGTVARFTGSTPLAFSAGGSVSAEDTTVQTDPAKTMMRFGFQTWGTLRNALLPLAMTGQATMIKRDFVRLVAVDLNRFLLGNRTASPMGQVPALDAKSVSEPPPLVREGANVRLQSDGLGVLGETGALLAAKDIKQAFLVSPAIDDIMPMPADATPASRWGSAASARVCPANFPFGFSPTKLPVGDWNVSPDNASALNSLRAGGGACTARWATDTGTDVIVQIAPGIIPLGAHVRGYQRLFVVTPDLAHNPTLFRGDGAATIAGVSAAPVSLLFKNPLNLSAQGTNNLLYFDLHVLPNNGAGSRDRIFGGHALKIGSSSSGPAPVPFAAGTSLLLLAGNNSFRGVCHARFLGLEPGSTLSLPDGIKDAVIDVIKVATQVVRGVSPVAPPSGPVEALRLPTMARYETITAVCVLPAGATTPTYLATLSGGFLTDESHCELYHLGNPGAPATPETHVCGLFADGWLGRDLALAACRRAQGLASRLLSLSQAPFNDPAATPATPSTLSGAVLQTVAAKVETPELSLIPEGQLSSLPGDMAGVQAIVAKYSTTLGSIMPASVTGNQGTNRVVAEIRREAYAAQYGRRDWQTSLRYALAHARELIYLETQCLTANPVGSSVNDSTFDVLNGIVDRLQQQPSLRLILVSPKVLPCGPKYQGWAQYFYQQRTDAWAKLEKAASGRVLAVHPIGFPGRPLNVRTSVCIIDDVWASLGTGVPRRRGLTFDGSIDVALFDAKMANGRGAAIANFRRALMAQILNVQPPAANATPAPDWTRLARPRTAFQAFADLVAEGGRGLVETGLWAGPGTGPNSVLAVGSALADPEGRELDKLFAAIANPATFVSL